eukprot:6604616-Ditylum_brightwellii.AAC.1
MPPTLTIGYASVVNKCCVTISFPPSHKGTKDPDRKVAAEKNFCGACLYCSALFDEKKGTGISGVWQKTVCQTEHFDAFHDHM